MNRMKALSVVLMLIVMGAMFVVPVRAADDNYGALKENSGSYRAYTGVQSLKRIGSGFSPTLWRWVWSGLGLFYVDDYEEIAEIGVSCYQQVGWKEYSLYISIKDGANQWSRKWSQGCSADTDYNLTISCSGNTASFYVDGTLWQSYTYTHSNWLQGNKYAECTIECTDDISGTSLELVHEDHGLKYRTTGGWNDWSNSLHVPIGTGHGIYSEKETNTWWESRKT